MAIGVTNLGDECHLLCGEFCSLPTARHSVGVEVGFFPLLVVSSSSTSHIVDDVADL